MCTFTVSFVPLLLPRNITGCPDLIPKNTFRDAVGNPIYYLDLEQQHTACDSNLNRCNRIYHKSCSAKKICKLNSTEKTNNFCKTLVTCGPNCMPGFIKHPDGQCIDPCDQSHCSNELFLVDQLIKKERKNNPDQEYQVYYQPNSRQEIVPVLYRIDKRENKVEIIKDLSEVIK